MFRLCSIVTSVMSPKNHSLTPLADLSLPVHPYLWFHQVGPATARSRKDSREFACLLLNLTQNPNLEASRVLGISEAWPRTTEPDLHRSGMCLCVITNLPRIRRRILIHARDASVVGSDVRKAVLDGYPVKSCLATDLRGGKSLVVLPNPPPPSHRRMFSLR